MADIISHFAKSYIIIPFIDTATYTVDTVMIAFIFDTTAPNQPHVIIYQLHADQPQAGLNQPHAGLVNNT